MSRYVFDASALMMFLNAEPGWETARDLLASADVSVSAVNLAEIVAKAAESGSGETLIRKAIQSLTIDVVAFDEQQAWLAGLLRPDTRHLGLSFADRACLALARQQQSIAVTCDRPWTQLNLGITIECIRP